MDWLDLLAVQGTLKSLLQQHSSKASILRRSAFFKVQLSHPYLTTGKTIALTRGTFVGKVMSLLFNISAFLGREAEIQGLTLHPPHPTHFIPQTCYPKTVCPARFSAYHEAELK